MNPITQAIPDPGRLLNTIADRCTNPDSPIHGPAHWRAVAWTGLQLLAESRLADPAVVLLFAMFHDSMRLDDGFDRDHGPRAATFLQTHHGKLFHLDADALRKLIRACHGHTSERHSNDPTIAVCWDADQLNLWRIGVEPDPAYLSTTTAKRPEVIEQASRLEGQNKTWAQIVLAYQQR